MKNYTGGKDQATLDFERYYFDVEEEHRQEREKVGKARIVAAVFIGAAVFLALLLCVFYVYDTKFASSRKQTDFYEYYEGYDKNVAYSVVGGDVILADNNPVLYEGRLYMPAGFIRAYVDPYIFWDKKTGQLTVTTTESVVRMKTDEKTYSVNDHSLSLSLPVYEINGEAYLPASLAEQLYNIQIDYKSDYKRAVVNFEGDAQTATALKTAPLRYEPDRKSDIEYFVKEGEKLVVVEDVDVNAEFIKVRAENGLIGFVEPKVLKDFAVEMWNFGVQKAEETAFKPFSGRFSMVWDQVANVDANGTEARRTPIEGLNVLSPTWFSFDKTALLEEGRGNVLNIADKDYVDWAHGQGYKVWALVTDNFDAAVAHAVLSNSDIREYVIKQLLSYVSLYELDGINVDFEQVPREDADFFIQFLREIAPLLRERGAVLSVDMYVPAAHNMYYNRTEAGRAADYIIIMAYDEYWSTSPESGPVASVGFVERAIVKTLEEVPASKTVLGIPFYTRVWTEKDGKATSESFGMRRPYELFTENGAVFEWDEETGTSYAEYTDADGRHRLWNEDEQSIQLKLDLADKYNLAGVAAWKRNLEKPGVWDLINKYKR